MCRISIRRNLVFNNAMLVCAAVVLHHRHPAGDHYDLMIDDAGRLDCELNGQRDLSTTDQLWTARVAVHPARWAAASPMVLTELPRHRRAYLHRQGLVSGRRGSVTRVAAGHVAIKLSTNQRVEMAFVLSGIQGRLAWQRRDAQQLLARFSPDQASAIESPIL